MIAIVAVLGGCAVPRPAILSDPDPADPGILVSQPRPDSVTAGNGVAFPVAPRPWGEVNRRVTPGLGKAP